MYLSAACQLQMGSGGKNPKISEMAHLSQVLKGIRATQATAQGTGSTDHLPVTLDMLRAIKPAWERTPLTDDRVMLWGAIMLCFFFGFCWSGHSHMRWLCRHSQPDIWRRVCGQHQRPIIYRTQPEEIKERPVGKRSSDLPRENRWGPVPS